MVGEVVAEAAAIAQHFEGLKDEKLHLKCPRGQRTESFSSELHMPQRQQIRVLQQSTPSLCSISLTAARAKAV